MIEAKRKRGRPPKKAGEKLSQLSVRFLPAQLDVLQVLAALHGESLSAAAVRCIEQSWARLPASAHEAIAAIQKVREELK